jgi:hypothetical protein
MTVPANQNMRQLRRFRLYRLVVNLWVHTVAYILFLNVLRALLPSGTSLEWLWAPWGLAMLVWAIPWFVLSIGFLFGAIRCPLCGKSFGQRYVWVTRRCSSCHKDVIAAASEGSAGPSNKSLERTREG